MKHKIFRRLFVLVVIAANGAMTMSGQGVKSENVFAAAPVLPKDLKRVVLLPLAAETSPADLAGGCDTLNPILLAKLIKTKKFEVISARPEVLRSLTGQSSWTGAEKLPADFFDSLQRTYGCDGVLFCQLTEFRAYAPLAVGWRMKLVDAHTQKIIWAADEDFDAKDPAVEADAKQFQKQQHPNPTGVAARLKTFLTAAGPQPRNPDDQWDVMNSPRFFGEYSAGKLLKTLPER